MIEKFKPDYIFNNIFEIKPDFFVNNNLKAVIFDIDDTLVANDVKVPTPELFEYFDALKKSEIKISLISNGRRERVELFNKELGFFASYKALKPRKRPIKNALSYFGVPPKNTALVGDQLFTDIYGGNRMGLTTILVTPIKPDETNFIKFKRKLEKLVLKHTLHI